MEPYYDRVGAHYLEKSKAYFSICTLSIDLCADDTAFAEAVARNMTEALKYALLYIMYCEGHAYRYDPYVYQIYDSMVEYDLLFPELRAFEGQPILRDWLNNGPSDSTVNTKCMRECEAKLKILYTTIESRYGTRGELTLEIRESLTKYTPECVASVPFEELYPLVLPIYWKHESNSSYYI